MTHPSKSILDNAISCDIRTVTRRQQLYWHYEQQGKGAVAIAAKRIAEGKTIYFDCFEDIPPQKGQDGQQLRYLGRHYFGIIKFEGLPALRMSKSEDLEDIGSHSLLSSGFPHVTDPVHIATAIYSALRTEARTFFIQGSTAC